MAVVAGARCVQVNVKADMLRIWYGKIDYRVRSEPSSRRVSTYHDPLHHGCRATAWLTLSYNYASCSIKRLAGH